MPQKETVNQIAGKGNLLTQKRNQISYAVTFFLLLIFFFFFRNSAWIGSKQIHTLMELAATVLAIFVGALALVRYYTRKNNTFLFIGAGFLGTAFLDGYHAIVTSTFFDTLLPSPPASLIPWSWSASRTFLAILMFLSYLAWRREKKMGKIGRIKEKTLYWGVAAFSLTSFVFFAFYPLPKTYYPELIFGRPQEFITGLFFLAALIGYLIKGHWKNDRFEHWVVLSLIVGFVSQAMFMPLSFTLFDFMFDSAHLLKKLSYVYVLIGLLISMFHLSKAAEERKEILSRQNRSLKKAKEIAEGAKNLAESSRSKIEIALAAEEKSKAAMESKNSEIENINKNMVGRELQMIELKKEIRKLKEQINEKDN